MWDGALYELVIFEVDPLVIESADSVRKLLLSVLKPPPEKLRMSGPTAQELEDGFGYLRSGESENERWHGLILRMSKRQGVGFDEEGFTVYEIAGRVFLIFDFGKRASYAEWPQTIYLGDRFPPLATQVQEWPKERLLQEVTQPEFRQMCSNYTQEGVYRDGFRMARDQVFVADLVRRGLDESEFQEVMDSPNGRYLLISELNKAGQTAKYAKPVLDTIHRYERLPDVNIRKDPKTKAQIAWSHLADLIRGLPTRGEPDFSETMLQLVAANHEAEIALNYISERVSFSDNPVSQDLADRVAATMVPAGLEGKRDRIIQHIRFRLSSR